ncbi:OmpA family protein [Pontibacter sp. SGAir0037]|uniref:OmpA family protein n=1 Tax=Pontibacter sp. SGAir0037 TaxID=2571030 RepID=UPI0010CD28B5|nr:OmpA family protein [Pontibacter sp. SGAir0037]QCR21039.1 hypothetical protein C1N53_00770 [Pontibacter sp. SGAir0037]
MRKFALTSVLLLIWQWAVAQHDVYKWQFSGYTGAANYFNPDNSSGNYLEISDNLLYRLEISRHLGNSFGVSLGSSFGHVRGFEPQDELFSTAVQMASVRGYFYTDNGWLFNSSAWLSPYLFAGYGLSRLAVADGDITAATVHTPAIPFGAGLKLRLSERWQLALQAEVVYLQSEHLEEVARVQNDYNSSFFHTGLTIGYSFGFRKSTFNAPQFYADNVALLQSVGNYEQPQQNVLEAVLRLAPKQVELKNTADSANLPQLAEKEKQIAQPKDTVLQQSINVNIDSTTATDSDTVYAVPVRQQRPARRAVKAASGTTTDSVMIRQPAAARQRQPVPVGNEAVRVPENERQMQVYKELPAERPVVVVEPNSINAAQARKQRERLAAIHEQNRQLLISIDSLEKSHNSDTAADTRTTPDRDMVLYLQQQTAVQDSMLLLLQQYERELAELKNSKAASVREPAAGYTTAVFFPINSHHIPAGSLNELNKALDVLRANPDVVVRLTGYADQSGNAAYNMALSKKRVEALTNFLKMQGVPSNRIQTDYVGDTKSTVKLNPLDRRVEIRIAE